ncbi:MAG: hypothetical protein HOQ41_23960 [Ensifer adhaerens]|jgi:hypothetical protein|nr:hypothetical protein [Ensifer adhaerens]
MMKSEYQFVVAAVLGAFLVMVAAAGDAEAQMRTRKGEYYEGIQRKPYGYYWIWPPVEQQPVYKKQPGKKESELAKPRKRPVQ